METKAQPGKALTWYERIWNKIELVNTNPELAPYLDVDKFPDYQATVVAKLIGQATPLTPPKTLKVMTPEKLGLVLGQQCATLYGLGEYVSSLAEKLEATERNKKQLAAISTEKHVSNVAGVNNDLHGLRIAGLMLQQLANQLPKFEKTVHGAFKTALDQPSHQESIEFFRGYAKGLATPGFKNGKLVGRTDATLLQSKMFLNPEQAANAQTVEEWRTFLLKNGFSEQSLGNPDRLQKFCSRIGYAPGKKKSRKKK